MSRTWHVVSAVLLSALLAFGLAACGDDDESGGGGGASGGGEEEVTVGLITKTEANPFFVKMKEGAQAAADKENVKLLTASGKSDTDNASQVTALENMTTQGAKGILLVPADSKAVVPAIEKARAAGVIVIALDTPTEPAGGRRRAVRDRQPQGRRADRPVRQGQGRGDGDRAEDRDARPRARASPSASCAMTAS